jgi:hypothetical protein
MKSIAGVFFALALSFQGTALAATALGGDTIQLQDMVLTVPDGWALRQDAKDAGTIILGFENAAKYVTVYVKQQTGLDMRTLFVNGSTVVRDIRQVPRNRFNWKVLETSKANGTATAYVASFLSEHEGHSYYGYARGATSQEALDAVTLFLTELR